MQDPSEAPDQRRAWWQDGVVYQIYPRSFADSDGDGVGDLEGIRSRLAHLAWLGVDAIWLSPVFRSPMADFGYDISDHCDIDPVFGDLGDMERLITDAHGVGIRVMLDWVPNHTSDQHPWFVESRASRESPKRAWYVWRDGEGGPDDAPPNNWLAAFGGRAWTWDDTTRQWYLHLFLPEQPDLDWSNPQVEAAMQDVLRFWLDRGVDGFRADVIHLIGKDPALPDLPASLAGITPVAVHDHPSTHDLLKRIRRVLDSYPGGRPMVGEIVLDGADKLAPYYGEGDELHLVFNFALSWRPWDALRWARTVEQAEAALTPRGAWPVWVLSNHDVSRHRTRYGGSEGRARVAAVVLLTLRGTPFLYAGEELGAQDAVITDDVRLDPGGRDGERAPIPWTAEPGYGWGAKPWLPFEPNAAQANVASLRSDERSILWLYRRLLALRRAEPSLHRGGWSLRHVDEAVLDYERTHGGDRHRVVANFGEEPRRVDGLEGWELVLRSDDPRSAAWDGTLPGEVAVVLRARAA